MKVINYIVLIISIIGCVNWGLIGLFDFNLVDMLLVPDRFFPELFIFW